MKKLFRRSSAFLILALSIAPPAISADQTVHMSGYIVDHMCAPSAKEKKNPVDYLRDHTKECLLMPGCSAEGFDFYSNGKWYRFDNNGVKMARQVLTASKVNAGNYVTVDGTVNQNRILVTKIVEAPAPK